MDALESIRRDNPQNLNGTASVEDTAITWNDSEANASKLLDLPQFFTTVASVPEFHHPYPTVDVPDHAHYVIGSVILTVGITGMVGNLLVMYAFSRSRSLRTPANMFIINLAVTDFLMCLSQSPMFFITSMHKRWIFGEKGCELYAFTGALFGICSMITLMVISLDRYFVITRPLTSIGGISRKRAALILAATWLYAMGWSLPPFFGWSAYVPEGLLTSCTWDYMTFSPSVRAYTMLLFLCVFFIPLLIIIYSYIFIFRAVRGTNMAVDKMTGDNSQDEIKKRRRMKSELKMAKIAFIVVLLYVISWSPYASVALTAFAGYADLLTPYVNSVPAVIAKASAIHNPIIYAITHPKYRSAIAKYIPFLGVLLCVPEKEQTSTSSFNSTRRFTVMSQTSDNPNQQSRKRRTSSVSDTDSVLTDTEADFPSIGSPAGPHVSNDVQDPQSRKPSSSFKSKTKGSELSISEKALTDTQGIAMVELGQFPPAVAGEEAGQKGGQIPSIVITTESTPGVLQPQKSSGQGSGPKTVNGEFGARPGPVDGTGIQQGPQIPFIGPKNST